MSKDTKAPPTLPPSPLFVAGATGATGSVFLPIARAAGYAVWPHVRPKTAKEHPLGADPDARVLDLFDEPFALDKGLRGAGAVVCLVGTMKKRFAQGDSYATSDVGAVKALVAAAERAGVRRFVLLSSYGAGGVGAYLAAKKEAEDAVVQSGLAFTVFRPSALVSPADAPTGHHGRRAVPSFAQRLGEKLAALPGVGGVVDDARPMPLEVLSRAMLRAVRGELDGRVLAGRDIFPLGDAPSPR